MRFSTSGFYHDSVSSGVRASEGPFRTITKIHYFVFIAGVDKSPGYNNTEDN